MAENQVHEGPLAEFVALRQEIDSRIKAQHQILSLQLTLTAAIFGFAVSRPNLTALLMIVPFSSYLLCGRWVSQSYGVARIGRYMRDELADRVPGGLRWEGWLARHQRGRSRRFVGWTLPLLLTFPGASLLALSLLASEIFAASQLSVAARTGRVLLWFGGVAAAAVSAALVVAGSRLLYERSGG